MSGPLAEIERFVDQLKSDYYQEEDDFAELVEKWNQLRLLCQQIHRFADEYDYSSKTSGRHNGCRSMVKIVSKLVPRVRETLTTRMISESTSNQGKDDDGWREATLDVTKLLVHLTELLVQAHEARGSIKTGKQATLFMLKSFTESRTKIEKLLKSYWGYYPVFWMDYESQWVARCFTVLTSSCSSIPTSLLSLISRDDYSSRQVDIFYNATPFYPLNVVNYANNPLLSSINWLSSKYNGMRSREIKVPRQNCWIIPDDGGKVSFKPGDESTVRDPIICRVIDHANDQPSGDVILHCQGGAFTVDFPACYDEVFRDWIPKLGGATIIDVCYTRLVRYPIMIQEALDVYLWLVSNQEDVKSILGWAPRKIILCGDSGGGLLLFSLSAVLRDIQIIASSSPSLPIPTFPRSLVMFYPILSLTYPKAPPSVTTAFLEEFLNPIAVFNCLALYSSGIVYQSECTNSNGKKTDYSQKSRWNVFYNTWINSDKNWLHCDPKIFDQVADKIIDSSLTPYKSPLVSYDQQLLKDLPIFLVLGEFDPFLDLNLDFAKSWPGKIKVDVMDDLSHGFLAFTILSKRSQSASQRCLQRILEALEE